MGSAGVARRLSAVASDDQEFPQQGEAVERMANARWALPVVVVALVLDMLAFTLILPLFPTLLDFYSKEPHRDSLFDVFEGVLRSFQNLIGAPDLKRYNTVFFGGLLGSLFSALQFLSSPTLGALSDVYGRKRMLIVSCTGSGLSYFLWLKADTFSVFVLSRVVGGLSKASVGVATAVVSDVYTPDKIPKGMALIGICYSVGFLIGPMVGAYFSIRHAAAGFGLPHSAPAHLALFLTALQLVLIAFGFAETLPASKRVCLTVFQYELQVVKVGDVIRKIRLLVSPSALLSFAAVKKTTESAQKMSAYGWTLFLYLFLYSGLEFTLGFLTHIRFNFDSMQQGKIYLFTGLFMLSIQGGVVRRAPIHKQQRVAEFGLLCVIPAFIIIALAQSVTVLFVGLFFYAIASATVVTGLTSCVSNLAAEDEKGATSGVFRSLGALARALGPIFAASLFWLVGPTACYLVGGLLLTIPFVYLRRISASPIKAE